MKSTLPATHLLRHFVLFALTILLLLTAIRFAYGFWQFQKIADAEAFLPFFFQGLRFDLALIGQICLIPVVIGSLLSLTDVTRKVGKLVIILFLVLGLFLVLALELLTPWFVSSQGVRPDLTVLGAVDGPMGAMLSVFTQHTVPVVIGIVVSILILIAFCRRLDMSRFIRAKVALPSGVLFAVLGGIACILAIWSTPDLRQNAFAPADAAISQNETVNELTMNTTYKALYSTVSGLFGS